MNSIALRQSLVVGIACGLLYAALSFGTYYAGVSSYVGFSYIYTIIPAIIIIIIIAGFNLRKRMGGFMNFKEVLQYAMVAYLVYEVIGALVTYLLFVVIDPELTSKMVDMTFQYTAKMMKSMGASQAEIDDMITKSKKQPETTGSKNILLGLGMSLVWDFVKSLLVAVIVKKERPADLEYTSQPVA